MDKTHKSQHSCQTCEHRSESALCSSPQVNEVIERIKVPCHFKADQVVFAQGSDPLGLYAVQSGLVKLEVVSEAGAAHTTRLIGPGGILGYRSLFSHESYHASAISVDSSELCFIPKQEVFSIFHHHPDVAMSFMNMMCKDLRYAEEKWVDQIDKDAAERTAEAVLFLQDHFHSQNWTRREIAQWAGTTPETVMRSLAQFEKDGLIAQEGRKIRIVNRSDLEKKAYKA